MISDFDIAALKGWKEKLDAIFKVNLLNGSKGAGLVKNIKPLLDNNDGSHISFSMTGNNDRVEINLKEKKTFNVLLLQENIRIGQRVEKFVFEYWNGKQWKKATEGTTIGFKRLLEFPTITASKVRLRFLSARLEPTLAEMGLYFDIEKKNSYKASSIDK